MKPQEEALICARASEAIYGTVDDPAGHVSPFPPYTHLANLELAYTIFATLTVASWPTSWYGS
jgi:hypothetical protein